MTSIEIGIERKIDRHLLFRITVISCRYSSLLKRRLVSFAWLTLRWAKQSFSKILRKISCPPPHPVGLSLGTREGLGCTRHTRNYPLHRPIRALVGLSQYTFSPEVNKRISYLILYPPPFRLRPRSTPSPGNILRRRSVTAYVFKRTSLASYK